MKVAISGYRGLIGKRLERKLSAAGHEIVRLERRLLYDYSHEQLALRLKGTDAVVHLSGAPILKRWTAANRKVMHDSRIVTTYNIAGAIKKLAPEECPKVVVSASAIGLYKPNHLHSEESRNYAGHFAAQLIVDWEAANASLPNGIRNVIFRIGLVLDREAELIKMLKIPFLLFAGGPIGNGRQPFPFIHLHDVTAAIEWAIKESAAQGVYNLVAPEQVSNARFSAGLGKRLHRPSWFPVPRLPLRLLFGQAAQLVYESPAVEPTRLVREKFSFSYPTLDGALDQIFESKA